MKALIQAIRGMHDILPEQTPRWQQLEQIIRDIVATYGYQEIRLPIVEKTELFHRSIGEVTDIVSKEMYTFSDRNGDSLTLRPEGTAGCVRAGIEQGLLYHQFQRLWYMGPMFRHERPQLGRARQFQQFGVEAFGMEGPDIDAELILMTARLWRALGLQDDLVLKINSLGSMEARAIYREQLVTYFTKHITQLDEDSQRRLSTNPLRILDSKNPQLADLIAGAPRLLDCLDEASAEHFAELQNLLTMADIRYEIDPQLVRGLDYYNRTVFEWVTDRLGAQSAVCAGGRYDGLVEQLSGKATPAVGFAMGFERILALWNFQPEVLLDIYFIRIGEEAQKRGLLLAEAWRKALPKLCLLTDCAGGGLKSQLKRADKSGARIAFVLGEDELREESISLKFLRENRPQQTILLSEVIKILKDLD